MAKIPYKEWVFNGGNVWWIRVNKDKTCNDAYIVANLNEDGSKVKFHCSLFDWTNGGWTPLFVNKGFDDLMTAKMHLLTYANFGPGYIPT